MKKTLIWHVLILIVFSASSGLCLEIDMKTAVENGIKNHESIKASKETEKQKEYSLKKAQAGRLFTVKGTYSYARLKETPVMKTQGTELESADKDNYSWKVTLEQPLFTGFALTSSQDIAKAETINAELDTKTAELDIAYKIKHAYSDLFLALKIVEVRMQTLETLEAHKEDAKKFYDNGLVPLNDLLKAEVSVSEAEIELDKASAAFKSSASKLNILMGKNPGDPVAISPLKEPKSFEKKYTELEIEAFSNRPEIRLLKTNMEIADLSKKIAGSNYYPKIYLSAGYEQNGEDYKASDNFHTNSHNASVGVMAEWIFFDFKKTGSSVKSAEYAKRALLENLGELKKNIAFDVEVSLRNIKVAEKNIATAKKSISQAEENFRITNIQYKKQTTTSTEVLNARTYLTTAQTGYFRALNEYWSARADLDRSSGRIF
ncbi:MAG: TolC family protein [Desulforegulaceae bacterium]|nr:TolC family protein [Desulforegulaceae bacterium]